MDALLAGMPPVALAADVCQQVFGAEEEPLAGYGAADWRAGKLPDDSFALRLLQEPGRGAAIATPQSGLGAELLLPHMLRMALMDGPLRHDLAQTCRRFLCERVLFHPGPPPQALFSAAAIAELCLSQPDQLSPATGRINGVFQGAVRQLHIENGASPLWDQWLYRRIDEASGWQLAEDLAALPWVAWQRGDPLPSRAQDTGPPDCWPNLIALDL